MQTSELALLSPGAHIEMPLKLASSIQLCLNASLGSLALLMLTIIARLHILQCTLPPIVTKQPGTSGW